jgi:osmoprotectant transport system permease protein
LYRLQSGQTVADLKTEEVTSYEVGGRVGLCFGRLGVSSEIEIPLASRVIMAGVRTSVIVNIGTATVAAATGAGGLGSPIFSGINLQNSAFVLEGAAAAAMLAVLADAGLGRLAALLAPAA